VVGVNRLLTVLVVLAFLIQPSVAISDINVKFVSYVKDLGKYIEKSPVYAKGDEVKVYVEAKDVNHFRAYAVDFVFVIYDPKGYPVAGAVVEKRGSGWEDEVYATYSFKVPDDWISGKYKLEVYAFDVLNSSATYEEYKSFRDKLIEKGEASIDVKTKSRKDVDYIKKTLNFWVRDRVDSRIYIFDSGLKAVELPVGMNNSLVFTVLNAGEKPANFYVWLYIDGKKFDKKKVELDPGKYERVEFEVPQLEVGEHRLEVVADWDNVVYSKILPIYLPPVMFAKPVLVSKLGKGYIVLSENDYVLGSAGASGDDSSKPKFPESEYDLNRDDAAKVITNVLAYTWRNVNGSGDIDVGLYIKSDERAEEVLPKLLEYVNKISKAPVKYRGVVDRDELKGIDVLFYVSDNPDPSELEDFVRNGGILILDATTYWFDDSSLVSKYNLKEVGEIYKSFFDFSSVNKTVSIKLVTELKLPPELKYSNLTISDFLVMVGEPVKISFDVKNEGGPGKAPVVVYVDDEEVYNRTLEFYPNEVKHIEITYVPQKEGAYKVTLDGSKVSKVFFAKELKKGNVTKAETPVPERKERKNAGLVAALIGLLALLVGLRIYLRR